MTGGERFATLGIRGSSLNTGAGHALTLRDHRCGEFVDNFDWSSLPPHYLRRVGAPCRPTPTRSPDNEER